MSEVASQSRSTPGGEIPGFPGFQQVLHLTLNIHIPPAGGLAVQVRSDPPGPDEGTDPKGDRGEKVEGESEPGIPGGVRSEPQGPDPGDGSKTGDRAGGVNPKDKKG
jgi:hypothetical protein